MPTKSEKKQEFGKDTTTIFDYIKLLKHERRILLLKALLEEKKPIAFMDLLRKCKLPKDASPDASYHLTELREKGIVVQQDTKYFLSSFGEELLGKFFELEDVFSEHASSILIRTSRYSMEPFSEEKIAASLASEAKMPPEKAVEVARETRIRLQRAKVQYLTAPLIREYINAVLIEKHMEEYRHKLTRLGVPGQDIEDALHKGSLSGLSQLRAGISRETLEQFALLRVFPKELADAVLQRSIGLSSLSLFPFLPEEVVIPWKNDQIEVSTSLVKLLYGILDILISQNQKFSRTLSITGVPLPSEIVDDNLTPILIILRSIEQILQYDDKNLQVIFEADSLPEVLRSQIQGSPFRRHIEFFCHRTFPLELDSLSLSSPIFIGPTDAITPCFESIYCNLLLLYGVGDDATDFEPRIGELSKKAADIIFLKEKSMRTYGNPIQAMDTPTIRLCPIGLPELAQLCRGFEVDQTEDSEQFAREILQSLIKQVSEHLGKNFSARLSQDWSSNHILSFAETASIEVKETRKVMYFGNDLLACSPGFLRPNNKLPISKFAPLATRFLSNMPGGEFHFNLAGNFSGNEKLDLRKIAPGEKMNCTLWIYNQTRIKIGQYELPVGTFF